MAVGVLCYMDRAQRWCLLHDQERFQTCVGCGADACRECPNFTETDQLRCGLALCPRCEHLDDSTHGTRPTAMEVARRELVACVQATLKGAARRGLISLNEVDLPVLAELLVDDQVTHTTLKVLSGLSMPPPARSE